MSEITKIKCSVQERLVNNEKLGLIISDFGRIFSLKTKKQIPQVISTNDYYYINWKGKAYSVHRLVAEAFIPNAEGKQYVDHINAIKTDNRAINLRWATAKENYDNPNNWGKTDPFSKKAHIYPTIDLNEVSGTSYRLLDLNRLQRVLDTKELKSELLNESEEYWIPIKGYENNYFISNHYRVLSILQGKPKILKQEVKNKTNHKFS